MAEIVVQLMCCWCAFGARFNRKANKFSNMFASNDFPKHTHFQTKQMETFCHLPSLLLLLSDDYTLEMGHNGEQIF